MRFAYEPFLSLPTPADRAPTTWRPVVRISVFGLSDRMTVRGILDTGATETILPASLIDEVEPAFVPGEVAVLQGPDGTPFAVRYGTVDLAIRLKRRLHRWHVKVGFQQEREEALLGHIGFLQFFTATFNGPEQYTTLKPNGQFPMPIMPT